MAERKFTKLEIAQIKEQIADLHNKGYRQREIAEKLEISQAMVSYYLLQIKEELAQRTQMNLEARRAREDEQLNLMKRLVWDDADAALNAKERRASFIVLLGIHSKSAKLWHLDKVPPAHHAEEEFDGRSQDELAHDLLALLNATPPPDDNHAAQAAAVPPEEFGEIPSSDLDDLSQEVPWLEIDQEASSPLEGEAAPGPKRSTTKESGKEVISKCERKASPANPPTKKSSSKKASTANAPAATQKTKPKIRKAQSAAA